MNGDLFDGIAPSPGAGDTEGLGGGGEPFRVASGGADNLESPPSEAADAESAAAEPGAGVVGYRETQKAYATRYGMSLRSIKLWIAEGRAAGKLPPLDDPEAMLDWWGEVKKNCVPPRLLAAAETAREARRLAEAAAAPIPAPAALPEVPPAAPVPAPAAPPPPRATALATGFAASLQRVRVAEAEAHERYIEAVSEIDETKRNDSKTERLRKAWSELSEQLRFLEKAAPDVLAKSGEMITRAEARRILSTLHGPIIAGVRSLFRRVRAKAGSAASLDDLEKLYSAEVERLFETLKSSEFAPAP